MYQYNISIADKTDSFSPLSCGEESTHLFASPASHYFTSIQSQQGYTAPHAQLDRHRLTSPCQLVKLECMTSDHYTNDRHSIIKFRLLVLSHASRNDMGDATLASCLDYRDTLSFHAPQAATGRLGERSRYQNSLNTQQLYSQPHTPYEKKTSVQLDETAS